MKSCLTNIDRGEVTALPKNKDSFCCCKNSKRCSVDCEKRFYKKSVPDYFCFWDGGIDKNQAKLFWKSAQMFVKAKTAVQAAVYLASAKNLHSHKNVAVNLMLPTTLQNSLKTRLNARKTYSQLQNAFKEKCLLIIIFIYCFSFSFGVVNQTS